MARSKSNRGKRDTSVITSPPLLASHNPLSSAFHLQQLNSILREVEDARQYHPNKKARLATTVYGGPASVTLKEKQKYRPYRSMQAQTKATISFKAPSLTVVCVRRKIRREVLHALKLKHAGRGGRRRLNWRSFIRC